MKRNLKSIFVSAILILEFCFLVSCSTGASGSTGATGGDNGNDDVPYIALIDDTNPLISILQLAPTYHDKSVKVVVPDGFTSIHNDVFTGNTFLMEIEIPASVLCVDDKAFYDCTNLMSVKFSGGSKLKKICDDAFRGCRMLEKINLPSGVQEIGEYAFSSCEKLETIDTLPRKLKKIGRYAFSYCKKIKTLSMSNAVTEIGEYAFNYCTSLKKITFSTALKKINAATLLNCTSLESIILPSELEEIDKLAFCHCEALSQISLPNGLKEIGDNVFAYNYSLPTLTLPSTVKSIDTIGYTGELVITNPDNLQKAGINFSAFINCKAIYVPATLLTKYKLKWSTYADKIKAIPE